MVLKFWKYFKAFFKNENFVKKKLMVEYVYMLMGDIYLYPKKLQFVANGQIVLVTCIYKFNNVFFPAKCGNTQTERDY